MSRLELVRVVHDCQDHFMRTEDRFRPNSKPAVPTHPIPFFGDILNARVVTIGVNPSATEFEGRGWPSSLDAEGLTDRLLGYFKRGPHPWFDRWEVVLGEINSSYRRNAAHVDLSPRATISQASAPSPQAFADMLTLDLPQMLRVLSLAPNVSLLIAAGAATNALYVNEFLARNVSAPNRFTGTLTRPPGRGKVLWHEFLLDDRRLPTYFCSSSPSDRRNPDILLQRVVRDRARLVEAIERPMTSP